MRRTFALALPLMAFTAAPLPAAVTESSPTGFSLKLETTVATSPEEAFARLLQIGKWWDNEHTYSGDAASMTLDTRLGGCFCEQLADGGFVRHMDVVYFAPGKALNLQGGLGPLQQRGASGVLAFSFKPEAAGSKSTRVTMTYTVSGFGVGKGLAELAPLVDSVLGQQMVRYKRFIETGKPAP